VLQCVLQCAAVFCRALQSALVLHIYECMYSVHIIQTDIYTRIYVAVCCSMLQCVAVWFSVTYVYIVYILLISIYISRIYVAVCCSVLQCVAYV